VRIGAVLKNAMLLVLLLVTGPCTLLAQDLFRNGPSVNNVPLALVTIAIYATWMSGLLWSRPKPGERFEAGCFLLIASATVGVTVLIAAALLPLPPDARPAKETPSLLMLAAYLPWMLLQFACFVGVWRSRFRAATT
jgi:hypothetical protein